MQSYKYANMASTIERPVETTAFFTHGLQLISAKKTSSQRRCCSSLSVTQANQSNHLSDDRTVGLSVEQAHISQDFASLAS